VSIRLEVIVGRTILREVMREGSITILPPQRILSRFYDDDVNQSRDIFVEVAQSGREVVNGLVKAVMMLAKVVVLRVVRSWLVVGSAG
jgi:hypothetical protein